MTGRISLPPGLADKGSGEMKSINAFIAAAIALLLGFAIAPFSTRPANSESTEKTVPLTLRARIPLPGVYGRIDHYGWDSKRGILIVSALGNNSVEIIDQWRRTYSIAGVEHPQASVYLPGVDRIVVSSQSGKLRFYDAATYTLIKTLDFGEGADTDNMRYDPSTQLLYVGFGGRGRGALATVDPAAMERRKEFLVGSHPESFQVEANGRRVFVSLPDEEAIAIIDRNSGTVTKVQITGHKNSHTLALDETNRRLFSAALQPGRFVAVDIEAGKIVAELPCVQGVDDLWFDAVRRRIYASGAGAIEVFQQIDADHYAKLARIDVGAGAGSTSLHVKTRTQDSLFMSWPNMLPQGGSEVLLYYVND